MKEITATEAARAFADVLDEVEHHRGEFTILRRGRPVAHLTPVGRGRGADVRRLLESVTPDGDWADDLAAVRSLVELDTG